MTKTDLQPGDLIHFLSAMSVAVSPDYGVPVQRGATVEVTKEIIEASLDRNGNSWLDLVDDEGAQVARYGQVTFRRGQCPEDVLWWNAPGDDASRGLAHVKAVEAAREISDPIERRLAVAKADETFGPRMTSRSLGYLPGDKV
ncbi:hypothetical protein [Microbacterium sp. B24]|uniref:hypothetical protein n=1 Tax=Microbacterium sp. B24 TaxID=95616 RepID=UPI00055A4BA5|nr:hypothetical protein [Microbacterium sp. B24]